MSAAEVHARRLSKKAQRRRSTVMHRCTHRTAGCRHSRATSPWEACWRTSAEAATPEYMRLKRPPPRRPQAPRPYACPRDQRRAAPAHIVGVRGVIRRAEHAGIQHVHTGGRRSRQSGARPGYGMFDGPMQSAHVEDAPKSPNAMAGFASMMRQRLEEDPHRRKPPWNADAGATVVDADGHGLGDRIVVEDEDELPSRIVNSTFDSQAETTLDADAGSANHSTSTSTSAHTVMGRTPYTRVIARTRASQPARWSPCPACSHQPYTKPIRAGGRLGRRAPVVGATRGPTTSSPSIDCSCFCTLNRNRAVPLAIGISLSVASATVTR